MSITVDGETKYRLTAHLALMRLVPEEGEPELVGKGHTLDFDDWRDAYEIWHPTQAPTIYHKTTPFELTNLLIENERSLDGNRVYDITKTYPLGATHDNEIHTCTFKVELNKGSVHSFFWHHIFYVREDSWLKDEKNRPDIIVYL